MQKINTSLNIYAQEKQINNNEYLIVSTKNKNGKYIPYAFNCDEYIQADELIRKSAFLDTYVSIATFLKPSNKIENIAKIYEHYIDIDQHDKLVHLSLNEAKDFVKLLEPHFGNDFPKPSYILYTGQGIHIHIKLINFNDLIKWSRTQELLMERIDNILKDLQENNGLYKLLSVDPSGKNPNRVLRAENTFNTKSNTYSQVIYRSNEEYTQDDLINNFNLTHTIKRGKNKGQEKPLKDLIYNRQNETFKDNEVTYKKFKPLHNGAYTSKTLLNKRINDLYNLIAIRNKNNYLEGYRNMLMSVAVGLFYEDSKNYNETLENLFILNREFTSPLKENEVKAWLDHWIRLPNKWQFKTETIVNRLEITPQEEVKMKVLISNSYKCGNYRKGNKDKLNTKKRINYNLNSKSKLESVKKYDSRHKEKKRQYDKERYKNKQEPILSKANNRYAPIKAINKVNKLVLKQEAKNMQAQGIKYKDIAQALNVSLRTIKNYVKE